MFVFKRLGASLKLFLSVWQVLQEMDEKRIVSFQGFMRRSVEIEKQVFPIIDTCLNGIIKAAETIDPKEVRRVPGSYIYCEQPRILSNCHGMFYMLGWVLIH